MVSSELTSLHLSRLELESVVDGVGSESSVGLGFLNDYPLVGGGDISNAFCQNFSGWRICMNTLAHEAYGKSGVFTRKVHYSCGKPSCPLCCRPAWATREARKVEARLVRASERLHLPVEHIFISINPKDYGIGDEKVLRAMALKACDELGIVGGHLVFHGSRHRRFERIAGSGFRQFGMDWKPHFHDLCFIRGGYTCRSCERKSNCLKGCGGFDDRRWQYYLKTGVYVKVVFQKRTSVLWSSWYELHHASVKRDAVRSHVGIWHGVCSYRKMSPVKVVKSGGECPVCKRPLENGVYTGKKNFVLNRYSPDYERDSMQDLCEDGLQVWYVVPKRSRESYAEGSNVKNGFVIRFASGNHE
jgi:hypothetical protein